MRQQGATGRSNRKDAAMGGIKKEARNGGIKGDYA